MVTSKGCIRVETGQAHGSSCETLRKNLPEHVSVRKTQLFVVHDTFEKDEINCEQPLYLPTNCGEVGSDECLKYYPQVMNTRNNFLSRRRVHFDHRSTETLLYVAQREVAHAVSAQCSMLVSDRATTCHIMALRSTSKGSVPLVSLCHIDGPGYDDCIRSMFHRHMRHHEPNQLQIDVYIVGGFEDAGGMSRAISNWLIYLMVDIVEGECHGAHVVLRLCVITSLNDTGHGSPVCRGLAINVVTGETVIASCAHEVTGPAVLLRSARMWSRSTVRKLIPTHIQDEQYQYVEPFDFKAFPGINSLLRLPDNLLLTYCSTSPDCEEDDFCSTLRLTLRFLRDERADEIFGKHRNRRLLYQRVVGSNKWIPAGHILI